MSFQYLLLSQDRDVATIRLNRPQQRNSFSTELLQELRAALAQLGADPEVRALILTGNGASFCAGADLSASRSGDAAERAKAGADQLRDVINPIVTDIEQLPFPVICAINGSAAGAGASLALAGDIVLAARSAFFLFPFMPKLGILPDMGATWHLLHRLGGARAMALSLIGDRLPAQTAADWGLIWRCVEDAELMTTAEALAAQLAAGPSHAALELRAVFRAAAANDLSAQLDYEHDRQRELLARAEFSEGVAAFMQKREPRFPPRASG